MRTGAGSGNTSGVTPLVWPREPLAVVLALLIFFTIGRAHQHFSILGTVRPALLLFLAAIGYALLKPSAIDVDNLRRSWPPKVVLALAVLACLSIPFGISVGSAGSFMVRAYSKVLITFFVIVVAMRRTDHLYLFVWSYVAACGFLVWVTVFFFDLSATGGMYRLNNLYTYDANDMGVVLTAGLPLCIVLFHNSGRWGRLASAAILLGIGASLARSGSRGGFLGLLAVGIALLLMLRHVSILKRAAFVGVVAAGLFAMAPQGYWEQMETLTEPTEDYNWEDEFGRRKVAKRGLGYMMDHPLFGVGVGNFPRAEGLGEVGQYRARMNMPYKWSASHNSFVQAGAEMGIPGLVLFCSLVFGGMIGMMRLRRRFPPWWRKSRGERRFLWDLSLYLPVSLVGFAVSGFFVSFAYLDVIYVLTAFVAGVYLMAERRLRDDAAASGESHGSARGRARGIVRPAGRRAVPTR